MKIRNPGSRRSEGNALLLTIVATGVIGLILAAYVGLVQSQNAAVVRSQSWNATIPVVEAGIEDALSHLNRHGDDTTLVGQGWVALGGTQYGVKRQLGRDHYVVTISNWVAGATNSTPIIESRGYVSAPSIIAGKSGPVIATVRAGNERPAYLARGIRVTTRRPALFAKGMVAKGNINMNNHNIYADSFDSGVAGKNIGGRWHESIRGDKGSVASNDGIVNVDAADVYGSVYTGPNGSFRITTGSVGDKAWVDAGRSGIQDGHYFNDMNMEFPDAKLPTNATWNVPVSGTVNGVFYDYVLNGNASSYWRLSSVGNAKIVAVGNVHLYVANSVSMQGNSSITVRPGASMKMYAGSSVTIAGNGVFNETGIAANFFLYGLPGNQSISLKGNGTFYGVIYAPSAALTLNGGGTGPEDFSGASITKSVDMKGHFKFHYDEALSRLGIGKGFVVTSWDEMRPNEVAAAPDL